MAPHFHLDPLGGLAGDMFAAALLDMEPSLNEPLTEAMLAIGAEAAQPFQSVGHNDGILTGRRFLPGQAGRALPPRGLPAIRSFLESSTLPAAVLERALAMLSAVGAVEAAIHGVSLEDVHFHEIGAWDSIVDFVAAASLITALAPATWSIAPLPAGSGRVRTAHGPLPVPAPATVALLKGFRMFDDGIAGERVTPTGAAIVHHLAPVASLGTTPKTITHIGYGFGQRSLQGLSNVLRVTRFEPDPATEGDLVLEIGFEIDDQTGEDLATGLDRLRQVPGVLDIVQWPVIGKKGRLAAHISVLAAPGGQADIVAACFAETSTIGLRYGYRRRATLPRRLVDVDGAHGILAVKLVQRPGGRESAKAEQDDLAAGDRDREARRRMAADAESHALSQKGGEQTE